MQAGHDADKHGLANVGLGLWRFGSSGIIFGGKGSEIPSPFLLLLQPDEVFPI